MQDLEITWPEGAARFSVADSPIHLGRSSGAAVPLTEGSVSRKHLILVWDGASWTANDNSTHGTFDQAGVRLPTVWALSGDRTVRLGGIEGVPVQIQMTPAQAQARPETAPAADARSALRPEPPAVATPQAPAAATPVVAAPPPDAPSSPTPDRVPVAESEPAPDSGFGGLFSNSAQGDRLNEPGPRFSDEKSLFPTVPDRQGPPPRSAPSPVPDSRPAPEPDRAAPSLLRSETVSAFADPVQGAAPPSVAANSPAPPSVAPSTPMQNGAPPSVAASSPAPPSVAANSAAPPSVAASSPASVMSDYEAPSILQGSSPAKPVIPSPGMTGGNPAIDPNSTLISDATLRVTVAGQDYSFLPGADVTIGRDPTCLIQLDERHSLVSRKHLRITHSDDAWWLEDYSSKGTFVDGKQLKKPYKAEGAFVANLGDDDAGTSLRIITAGEHRAPRDRTPLVIAGLIVAALVPLIALLFLLNRDDSTTIDPDFATAKKSTVMLFGLEGGQGSGFFVSDDLILTNQHVSVLSPQLLVGVSRDDDLPAQIEYATELVANHPFLDLAVLRVSNRVTRTSSGTEISAEPVGDIDLPAVTIGDSANVTIGDRVFNTGFPGRLSITSLDDAGELRLPSVVATSGEAANFAFWPGCSNADAYLYIPADSPEGVGCSASGDLNQGVLLSSFFSSGQGASGSAVYHNNEVVAVVYAGADGETNANLGITTAIFSDWLAEIIAQNP